MPSQSTPRRKSKRPDEATPTKLKSVDVGQPLGPYDTNTVRDRVRQWQATGGGVIAAPDIGLEEDGGDISGKRKIDIEQTPKPTKPEIDGGEDNGTGTSRRRNGRRKSKASQEGQDRDRSGSAPPKRVVSDQHWRKNRSPPGSAGSSPTGKRAIPIRTLPDDGIRVKPIYTTNADIRSKKIKKEKSPTKERRKFDDGIRVYSTPQRSRRSSRTSPKSYKGDSRSGSGDNSDAGNLSCIGDQRGSSAGSANKKKRLPAERSLRIDSSVAKQEPGRRTSWQKEKKPERQSRPASSSFSEARGSSKSHTSNLLSQVFGESKRIFVKSEPAPISTPRIPSIEAWLNDTPDPFVDADQPPVEIPSPLRKQSKPKIAIPEPVAEDPNKIWDVLESKDKAQRSGRVVSKGRKRLPSSTLFEGNPFPDGFIAETPLDSAKSETSASKSVDLENNAPRLSPSSLTRKDARRDRSSLKEERRKSSPLKEYFVADDKISAVSSTNTGSSVESPGPFLLRPPGLYNKRPFPSTGRHRLSTIASVETFNAKVHNATPALSEVSEATALPPAHDESEAEERDHFDPNSLVRTLSKSRLTKHSDLISVLSLPRAGTRSIVSARSIRTNRSRLATATIGDIMTELATDEVKYMRELRTLVDGVIPVLLTCALSKTDSAIAAGLFRPLAASSSDVNITKPIVDMGIALERLKTLHKRVPLENADSLLTWAQGAQIVYAEYLKAWRMGFQDVVVNLAPAEGGNGGSNVSSMGTDLDQGLPRNEDGDVVNGDGERVDVAFLLKRPLVRLKYLAKTMKGINFIKPSAEAESLTAKYQDLVIAARQRSNEECARLEDEAAASIDPSRARDPRTLAPLAGVTIDRTRCVRARDHFNLTFRHSSGQQVDCRVELLLRDEAFKSGTGGDLLICEVDGSGRWLLLPPVQCSRVSARNGDIKGEVVVMIRGFHGNGLEWHELLSIRTEDEQTGFEWVQMLGLNPVPPRITRTQSFVSRHRKRKSQTEQDSAILQVPSNPTTPMKSRTPSPREIEVPIGEQAGDASKMWVESSSKKDSISPPSRERARLQKTPPKSKLKPKYTESGMIADKPSVPLQTGRDLHLPEAVHTPSSLDEVLSLPRSSPVSGLRRSRANRKLKHNDESALQPASPGSTYLDSEPQRPLAETVSPGGLDEQDRTVLPIERTELPRPTVDFSQYGSTPASNAHKERPSAHRLSSVPNMELPTIPKIRTNSPPTTPDEVVDEEPVWPEPSSSEQPRKLTKKRPTESLARIDGSSSSPTDKSPLNVTTSQTPILSSSAARRAQRRSSSPLKHEYEPSTASESSSDSDTSTVERNEVTSISDSSEDEELEDGDAPTPLLPLRIISRFTKKSPQGSLYSLPNKTLTPSQSASQAPYKTVPAQPTKAAKTIASIFSWSDTGSWQSLHPDECSIVVTPGLIEAYEMSATHSQEKPLSSDTPVVDAAAFSDLASNLVTPDTQHHDRPLVALELTPLVPIRRGTALDVSIRSPPTANSQVTSGNNIMFRSRNPEECEALYALINHSRINNPTYIALQNARGPYTNGSSFSAPLDRRNSTRRSSWFGGSWGGGSSGYRASSAPTPSIAPSESSIGSVSSAFSALKRFGRGGGMFNISRSTIGSRNGSRSNSIYTSSDDTLSGSGASTPLPAGVDSLGSNAPIGLTNAKIRLYTRETASKWRDMGAARLTIMQPEAPALLSPMKLNAGAEKRILIHGKTKGEVLLDVCLGESRFERVARTGIALSVWEDSVGTNGEVGVVGAVGGVGGGRARVFMIQMKSERDTAYTFSIVGKLRY